MNTKKKHKHRPKPPNVNTPKVESEVKFEEKVDEVVPKSELKEEVPVLAPTEEPTPVLESAEPAIDTPKKPKRNKGKKKNQGDESFADDSKEILQSEFTLKEDPVIDIKEQDEDKFVDAAITPSARKNKNKKKPNEQLSSQTDKLEKESLEIRIEELNEEVGTKKDLTDPENKECPKEEDEEEVKSKSKKKTKKKKHNDSEKSDRAEEVSCTSAFQQLLIVDDKTVKEETDSTQPPHTVETTISTNIPEHVMVENVAKTVKEDIIQDTTVITDVEAGKDGTKHKKKNKKDKKHSSGEHQNEPNASVKKEDIFEIKQELGLVKEEHFEKDTCIKLSPCDTPENKEEPIKPSIEKELSPKPKAKIAKPVEKKRKGQHETPLPEELISSSETKEATKEESAATETLSLPHVNIIPQQIIEEKPKHIEPLSVIECVPLVEETLNISSNKEVSKNDEFLNLVESIPLTEETLKVSDSKVKDKKRKKSPKLPTKEAKTEAKEETLSQLNVEQKLKMEMQVESKTGENRCETENIASNEPIIPLQETKKSEPFDDVPPLLKLEETHVPENKSGKKKRKTLKVPTISTESTQLPNIETTATIDQPPTIETLSEPTSAPLADIEIRSVKTDESEGSSCDVTPDVHFIRSSSHQLLDDNNNMMIHEVRNMDTVKQSDSFTEPLVHGSGETPSSTPDVVSGNKKTRNDEPTYLKSKMMEVNQDMEDLRLSIERSLAEFSAMEKSEQKAEKEYEAHRIECEKTFFGEESVSPKPETKIQTAEDLPITESLEIKHTEAPPVCPARKDNKGKNKNKKKGKQESATTSSAACTSQSETTSSTTSDKDNNKDKQEKSQKTDSTESKGKQQSDNTKSKSKQQSDSLENKEITETQMTETIYDSDKLSESEHKFSDSLEQLDFAPIDNFEDALTSSIDDVNKSFELIVSDVTQENQKSLAANKPEINVTAPVEEKKTKKDKKDEKVNPVSQPKNFLGQTDIPAQSNRTDYKKEKNKTPNERQARVKIKDAAEIEAKKQSKECQTELKRAKKMVDASKSEKETFSRVKNDNEEYVYKYSFRKVFLQSACHVCHKDLVQRVPCSYCNLVFYCGSKHKDEDWTEHQALCFAVSTIAHLRDQKHIYADAQNITGQEYRLLRMQMIVSCEKVLKRRLVPWEQEAMLYPRICAEVNCREWRQTKLKDCEGCGQISYCSEQPVHLPKSHQRWCKSYMLYAKLVGYQQTRGRLDPKMPTKVMGLESCSLPEKMNEVLASMYEEKIDMNDIQYAALTQLATAPLTAAHCYQMYKNKLNSNGVQKKQSFTIHVVGAELQFEADALHKWEVFFLHLQPAVEQLRVALISPALNPGELPLDLLGKIRLCDNCRQNKRRVVFSFQDKKNYSEYRSSEDFVSPDLVCVFNPSIQRSSVFNGKDPWPATINCIIKQRTPFIITGYTITELRKDIARIKDCSEADFRVISEPVFNNFASVRPDRNFISDDDMPLLFKNYCVAVLCGC